MSATYPPYKSFILDDEDQQPTNSYNNPYSNNYLDGGNQFENTNSTLNQAGLKTEKSRVSFNQAGLNAEKTRSSLNHTGSIPEHTNSTLIQTSQHVPDSNNEVDPSWIDHPPHSHNHARHTHTHHQHDSDGHQHHLHHHHDHGQPQHEHIHHQHHEHIHHQHEQPQHDHEHIHQHHHDHGHSHHNHIHDHHSQTPPLPPIHHHGNTTSALTIRRHIPGSADPILHSFPSSYSPNHIYTSPMQEIPPPPNLHVTIRRNTPQVDHTLIQPILYPVAVFTNSSAPQPIKETPKPRSPKPRRLPPKSPPPKPPTPKPRTPLRTSPIPPVSPAKPSPVPPKPPVIKPVKPPPPPPPSPPPKSPVRPEPSPVPPPKTKNVLVRKPVRTDVITSTVRRVIQAPSAPPRPTTRVVVQQQPRPVTRVVVQEPPNYNQHRRPAVYPGSKKLVSYRTVPGMTTREMENDEMDDSGAPIFVQTPRVQTVTYRT